MTDDNRAPGRKGPAPDWFCGRCCAVVDTWRVIGRPRSEGDNLVVVDAGRLQRVFAAIDAINADDPHMVEVDGRLEPAELVYGWRITDTLHRMVDEPSEPMRIAARGQHTGRWRIARKLYPEGRAGYLAWRQHQRKNQAERLGQIMAAEGYGADDIDRAGILIRKENMKTDPEVQIFEDVICVMFFEHYLRDFLPRVAEEKLAEILVKTWGRMSSLGRQHVLALELPEIVTQLMKRELGDLNAAVTHEPLSRQRVL